MMLGAHSWAFLGNSSSKRRNVYLASSGTFERNAITSTPSGERSPVETSSGRTMATVPVKSSGSSSASGGSCMFGPRGTSILSASSSGVGARIWASSTAGYIGASGRSGYSPSSRGSVITPYKAVAAAVGGLDRYTLSDWVPLLPGKFLLNVLTLTESEGGAWPIPTHGPHAGSSIRAPARTRSAYTPVRAMEFSIWRLPGVTVITRSVATDLSFNTAAAIARSSKPELTELPMHTW